MKSPLPLFTAALLAGFVVFFSCSKERSVDTGAYMVSSGSLQTAAGDCLPSSVVGNFKVGVALTTASYIEVEVEVDAPGRYAIKSDTLNGFYFMADGVFTTPGINIVRLLAYGKPVAQVKSFFSITYGITTCHVAVDAIDDNVPPGVFTLGTGTNSPCTGAVLAGTYQAGAALSANNTVSLSVNVTKTGSYSLSIPAVNGISFSKTGLFAATGVQTVTLTGSGTPTAAGTFTFKPAANATACTFDIVVVAAPPVGAAGFSCKVDGTAVTFNHGAVATLTSMMGMNYLTLQGSADATGKQTMSIMLNNIDGKAIAAGSYSIDGFSGLGGHSLVATYSNFGSNMNVFTAVTNTPQLPKKAAFNFVISSISATRLKGTFNGKMYDSNDANKTVTITDGTFDVPVQ